MKRVKKMTYIIVGLIGIVCLSLSTGYFLGKKDTLGWANNKYKTHFSTSELTITILGGATWNLQVNKQDRISAWKIYNEINTRIASVDFNDNYDSFYFVNKSLYQLFTTIRNELANLPIDKIKNDKDDQLIKFYHSILNEGIRPYLSKWHIPVSHYIEVLSDQKKSILERELIFPKRVEILKDIKAMNTRMKNYSEQLLKIVKVD